MGKSIIHISVWKGQTTHWLVTTKYWENSLFPVQIYSVSLYSTEISDFFLVHWWYLHAFSFNSCNPNRLARVSCCHFRHYSVNGKVPKCPWLSSASVDTLADDHSLYRPWPFFFLWPAWGAGHGSRHTNGRTPLRMCSVGRVGNSPSKLTKRSD